MKVTTNYRGCYHHVTKFKGWAPRGGRHTKEQIQWTEGLCPKCQERVERQTKAVR